MSRKDTNNYQKLFLSDAPLIDLRAPCEFSLGAFPSSANLPLMSDSEREKIGTCYKKNGRDAAIKLGHELVSGDIKDARIKQWKKFAQANLDTGYFYCFRGGLRSKTSQAWLTETGINFPMVEGGYKAMRRFLIDETEAIVETLNINVITGLTGSAKTKVINQIPNSIDLEALANHRGSSFGKQLTPQPTQIGFENSLGIEFLKFRETNKDEHNVLYLEDESRLIGSRSLPLTLKGKMDQSALLLIEESFEYRVEQIFEDYVVGMYGQFREVDKEKGIELYNNYLVESASKIKKRLGGAGFKEMLRLIAQAVERQRKTGDLNRHKRWIEYLLNNYYDAMYNFQLKKKSSRVVFKGDTSQVMSYIKSKH